MTSGRGKDPMNGPSGWQRLTGWVPGLRLVAAYDRSFLPGDLMAGLVVALVVIPSAIAYADLANCPPIAGLYAALGGMIAFALFTTSRHVIAGPDAAIAILVGAAVGPLSGGDPGQAVVLSTWLALLAAGILLLAGWLKLGGIAEYLSSPVMLGFMNGAAVVIIVSQIGKLCGIRLQEENTPCRMKHGQQVCRYADLLARNPYSRPRCRPADLGNDVSSQRRSIDLRVADSPAKATVVRVRDRRRQQFRGGAAHPWFRGLDGGNCQAGSAGNLRISLVRIRRGMVSGGTVD